MTVGMAGAFHVVDIRGGVAVEQSNFAAIAIHFDSAHFAAVGKRLPVGICGRKIPFKFDVKFGIHAQNQVRRSRRHIVCSHALQGYNQNHTES